MSFDLTNKNIQDTFQNLLQKTGSEGRLFDLKGNQVRDLTIDGTLTVNSFITSESIINTSSGSTAFGNSSDDSHTFTGNITASGNISSSNDIFAFSGSFNYLTASILDLDGETLRIGGESFTKENITRLKQGKSLKPIGAGKINPDVEAQDGKFVGNIELTGSVSKVNQITASGNISSSGVIIGSNLSGTNTGDQNILNLAVTGSDVIFNHITASGDISASGDIICGAGSIGSLSVTPSDASILRNLTIGSALFHDGDLNTSISFLDDTINFAAGGSTSLTLKEGHVTASGNISSSGAITANELKGGNTQNTGSFDFPGAIMGYNVQGLNLTHATYNLTTTLAVPDAGFNVCFVAPKSGIVEIEVQFMFDMGTGFGTQLVIGLSDNATYNTVGSYYEQYVADPDENDDVEICHKWVVPSLTAGDTYKYWLGAKVLSTSGTPKIVWGGNSSGRFVDFIMKATALPSNTTIET